MKVHPNALTFRDSVPRSTPVVLTIGTFDGVHAGHRAVLGLLATRARALGAETVLLTFHPHPRLVLQAEKPSLALLNTLSEKEQLLSEAGLDHLVVHPFTRELARMTPLEYVRELIGEGIQPAVIVVGYDHRFGRNREGDFDILSELGQLFHFEVEELPAQHVDDTRVSSTKVREALAAGHIEEANHWLQSRFSLSGTVVGGNQIGRTLGFPTANLGDLDPLKLIPHAGVYLGTATTADGNLHPALINIGTRPTIHGNGNGLGNGNENGPAPKPTVEAHLLDFNRDIYGEPLTLEFLARIRDEQRFASREALVEAMEADRRWAQTAWPEKNSVAP